ncbi:alpha/beta hydrolase [Limosilactobacillus reuteri]|uniref:Alpha/beta hydrolase n=2 Tax=Limosilactobacillus reuteri TaxID=1598 RepID=A0A317GU08_LIMRT|nr:alpha/beta hydrolase [Limosilactobacillus reuteri]MBV0921517.1 alpha/beta hydrolase [Limosilactobacillus reuteri]MCC4348713.1 alpha/beta hydrolase [Limosilactobacillus reuteri]MCC4375939.1 alpha/beta hydrolase [Limosilactobacillus reuteri]MCC4381798.1 alpha/beta hydrolase [Limosilactobacillus reuteri]MCC4386024.1 alpha/beta hydrolase [Limosilactobacillus reuteri]
MKKSHIGIGVVIVIVILAIIGGAVWRQQKHSKYVQSTTPTLFFHGGGSSYHAEEHMVNAAKKAGVTSTVLRADVANNGKVTLHGSMHKGAINPIVEVNYDNNRQLDFNKHGEYATNVVKALQKRYRITKINMVGHSLGNISIIYYMLQNGKNQNMPQLQKQVDIAGHFAGLNFKQVPAAIQQPVGMKLNKDGKPNEMNATYRQMTEVRQTYPKGQVAVLNIIGDVGNHSDGTVDNVSSLSLRYLVAARAKSYRVLKITGKDAQHSKLHNNAQVDKALINFLWGK